MKKFTQLPANAFSHLQLNAGILVDEFTPATGTVGNILGATTGGFSFASNPTYSDFGEDVDNCPNNMLELKVLESYDATMSGTFLSVTPSLAKELAGAADIATGDNTHIVPRSELKKTDFGEVWWVGDYSDVNTGSNAGFIAIHLKNALNQAGFQITSGKNEKGQFAFEYHAHYSMENPEEVPFEIYVREGTA